jgi:uncharacterized membrane protein
MLREQMDDLLASIKSARRERDLAPFVVLAFALFTRFINGEELWGRLDVNLNEAFVAFALLVIIYGVFSIRVNLLQTELRTLAREYWGVGPKAPEDEGL